MLLMSDCRPIVLVQPSLVAEVMTKLDMPLQGVSELIIKGPRAELPSFRSDTSKDAGDLLESAHE